MIDVFYIRFIVVKIFLIDYYIGGLFVGSRKMVLYEYLMVLGVGNDEFFFIRLDVRGVK